MSLADAIIANFGVPSPGAVNDKLIAFFKTMKNGNGSPVGGPVGPGFYYDLTNFVFYANPNADNVSWAILGTGSFDALGAAAAALATANTYTDTSLEARNVKQACLVATAAALPANVATAQTLTGAAFGALTVDGVVVAVNDRVLVKNEAAAANNGIYVVTATGAVGAVYVLTRAADMNSAGEFPGAYSEVLAGAVNVGTSWEIVSPGPFVVGATAVNWTEFQGGVLPKSGGTMTGAIVLAGDPTTALNPVTKQYGDANYAPVAEPLSFHNAIAAWAAVTVYKKGDVVSQLGSLWIANANFTSGATFDPTNWTLIEGGGFGFPYTVDPGIPRATDLLSVFAANAGHYARCLYGGTVTKIGMLVGVSSGNISVAVYRSGGVGRLAVPTTQLLSSGSVACPTTGYAEVSLGGTAVMMPGDWIGLSADNVTATFSTLLATPADDNRGLGRQFRQSAAHPLPAGPSTLTATAGRTYILIGVA